MSDTPRSVTRVAAGLGGDVLAVLTGALSAVRPAPKPLHPDGRLRLAVLHRDGLAEPVGVPLLDGPGPVPVLARESRAVGLPAPLPDVHGLALRTTRADGRPADLLLASTGTGPVTRFVLTVGRTPYARPMTTLLPYRSSAGPLVLGVVARGEHELELRCAVAAGAWQRVGTLALGEPAPDQEISFDPVVHRPEGLEQYGWVLRLREPAYARARASRD
ncbi:hypothetical protein [Nocardioides sp. SYSU D00038]|uniref:hypothetical protein n=1 Tax=Nocardioides sp. SYSU D00038 TaxID=2812554 RepID=UPI001967F689|nr:hypothetical protein [Nocardioides sp. SYSU D00038]